MAQDWKEERGAIATASARAWKYMPAGKRQTAERVAGSGYLSQNDGRLHFGLGAATTIDKLIVHWPSGREQTLEKQGVDRVLTVEEPKCGDASDEAHPKPRCALGLAVVAAALLAVGLRSDRPVRTARGRAIMLRRWRFVLA